MLAYFWGRLQHIKPVTNVLEKGKAMSKKGKLGLLLLCTSCFFGGYEIGASRVKSDIDNCISQDVSNDGIGEQCIKRLKNS